MTNQAGAEVGRVQYDPYGSVLTTTLPVTLTDRLYTGQRWEPTTGLYDYRARFYDPFTGSFIQPDSIVPDPMNPAAWNRFGYVYGNPANLTDPSGHIPVPLILAGVGLFALGGFGGHMAATSAGYEVGSPQWYGAVGAGGFFTLASGGLGYYGLGLAALGMGIVGDTIVDAAILGQDFGPSLARNAILNVAFDVGGYAVGRALKRSGRVFRATPADVNDIRAFGVEAEAVQAARGFRSFGSLYWEAVARNIEAGEVSGWFIHRNIGGKITGMMKLIPRADALEVKTLESFGGGTRLMRTAFKESFAQGYNGRLKLYSAQQAIGFYKRFNPSSFHPDTNLFIWK